MASLNTRGTTHLSVSHNQTHGTVHVTITLVIPPDAARHLIRHLERELAKVERLEDEIVIDPLLRLSMETGNAHYKDDE